jgi:hypothetical protein
MRWIFALLVSTVAISSPASAQCDCYGGSPALGLLEPEYAPFYNTDANVYTDFGLDQVYVLQPRVAVPNYAPRYYTQPYDYGHRFYGYGRCGWDAGYRVC